jgi:Acyl-CoA reductase (LuxC).
MALKGITKLLNPTSLVPWASSYHFGETKSVGVAMAGNIPLVGFHDFLCVLMAGHRIHIKMSSQDSVLLQFIMDELVKIQPDFSDRIVIADKLKNLDAVIATGSDNTARYFEYYFRNIPHIIRKNRSSCAIIMGEEPQDELKKLSVDVFSYFGLGCRNVAKVFVPAGYKVTLLLDAWADLKDIIHHHKYANNYDYQKSILLVNQVPFYDNGFVLLTANSQLVSPISVLYYEDYNDLEDLNTKIKSIEAKTQCIVSANGWFQGSERFGEAQFPSLTDYADQIDTMSFLEFKAKA